MNVLKRIRAWLLRKKSSVNLADISRHEARDIGVSITRIRLPSGVEVVLIERVHEDENP